MTPEPARAPDRRRALATLTASWRLALMNVQLARRTPTAMFFSLIFPLIFLFVYGALFAKGSPRIVAFLFGPVVVLQILSSTFFGLGVRVVQMRERGSLRRYRLAPIGPGAMVLASLLANYLLLLPTVALLFICARAFFAMPLAVNWWDIFWIVTIGDFAFAGFGLVIGSLADTMQEAQVYSNAVFFPLLFLSGATIPLAELPHWLQRVAAFLPATYLVNAFQAEMPRRTPLSAHAAELTALVVAGAVGMLLAVQLFRWEKEERLRAGRKLSALASVAPLVLMGIWMNTRPATFASWDQALQAATSASAAPAKHPSGTADRPGGAAAPSGLVSDFENPGGRPRSRFGAGWSVTTDALQGGTSTAAMRVVAGGAEGSRGSLLITGRLQAGTTQPWAGAMFSPGAQPFSPADLSAYHAITFWARGDGQSYEVLVFTRRDGFTPAMQSFTAGAAWKRYRFPLSAFQTNGRGVEAIIFSASARGPFRLGLDNVAFQ